MLGLVLGQNLGPLPIRGMLVIAFAALVVAAAYFRHTAAWAAALTVSLTATGAALYEIDRARLQEWDNLPPREIKAVARVDRVFVQPAGSQRVSGLARIHIADSHVTELVGQRIYFSLRANETISTTRSSEIELRGVLTAIARAPTFGSFDSYLASAGVNFKITRGRLASAKRPANAYYRFCERMQQRFGEILSLGLEKQPALAGILRAMMLGQKHELSDEQDTRFMQSGTMHLFAISGLHIAAIAVGIETLLALLRIPRWPRFVFSTILLWLYVDITGGSPSAVRAFVMVFLFHAAGVLRVPVNPIATLGTAAFVTLVLEPMQLFSASFQMSYGIVAALILLGSPLSERWQAAWQPFRYLPEITWTWWHRSIVAAQRALVGAIAVGLASTLVSTITGLVFFRLLTPGALIANLVLIPISSLVIFSGFASLVVGLCGLHGLAGLFNQGAALVLYSMDQSIAYFVTLPGMYFTAGFSAAWIGFAAFGVLMMSLCFGYAQQWHSTRGGFWPPFVLTAGAVAVALFVK